MNAVICGALAHDVMTCRPTDACYHILRLMIEKRARHILVMERVVQDGGKYPSAKSWMKPVYVGSVCRQIKTRIAGISPRRHSPRKTYRLTQHIFNRLCTLYFAGSSPKRDLMASKSTTKHSRPRRQPVAAITAPPLNTRGLAKQNKAVQRLFNTAVACLELY